MHKIASTPLSWVGGIMALAPQVQQWGRQELDGSWASSARASQRAAQQLAAHQMLPSPPPTKRLQPGHATAAPMPLLQMGCIICITHSHVDHACQVLPPGSCPPHRGVTRMMAMMRKECSCMLHGRSGQRQQRQVKPAACVCCTCRLLLLEETETPHGQGGRPF